MLSVASHSEHFKRNENTCTALCQGLKGYMYNQSVIEQIEVFQQLNWVIETIHRVMGTPSLGLSMRLEADGKCLNRLATNTCI